MTSERLTMVIIGGVTALAAYQALTMLAHRSSTQIHHGGPNMR